MKKNKKIIKILKNLGILIGIFVLIRQIFITRENILVFLNNDEKIINFFLSFVIIVNALSLQIVIWMRVMGLLNIKLPPVHAFMGFSLSFVPKYIPGTFWGYISRNEWLSSDLNVNRRLSTLGTGIELFVIFWSLLFMIILNFTNFHFLINLIILIIFSFLLYYFLKIILNNSLIKNYFGEQYIKNLKLKSIFPTYFFSSFVWFIYGLGLYVLAGNNISGLFLPKGMYTLYQYSTSFSLAWLLGFLAIIIPSGLGVREGVLASLIETHQNIGYLDAMSIAVLFRFVILLGELLLVIFGLIHKMLRSRRRL